ASAQGGRLRVGASDDASEQQADRLASLATAALRGPGLPFAESTQAAGTGRIQRSSAATAALRGPGLPFAESNAAAGTGRIQRSAAATLPVSHRVAGLPLIQRKVTFEWKSKKSFNASVNGVFAEESTFSAIE